MLPFSIVPLPLLPPSTSDCVCVRACKKNTFVPTSSCSYPFSFPIFFVYSTTLLHCKISGWNIQFNYLFGPSICYGLESNTKQIDWVADMIDGEIYRQDHHKEYEAAWMEKNKGAVLSRLSDERSTTAGLYPSQMVGDGDREAFAEHKRDERMAFLKPEKYCADRCLATGNCDIFEDFYEMGPQDVLKFCEECVLDFDEENLGCDVPEAFYEKEPPLRP